MALNEIHLRHMEKKLPQPTQKIPLFIALVPFLFLIGALSYNVIYLFGDNALSGSNQLIIMLATGLTAILGWRYGITWETIRLGMSNSLGEATQAIAILLLIGALAGTWLISGVVPAMIYYGLDFINPNLFFVTAALVSAIVSLATGSSWSTTATVGIALLGIGKALGFNEAMIAGAIISGAYFGDKLSPLSDTTNLAPIMAGAELFSHIKYMLYTTIPSLLIALIVFFIWGWGKADALDLGQIVAVQEALQAHFTITPWLFLVPGIVVLLIFKKVPALPALLVGALAGAVFAFVFQPQLLSKLGGNTGNFFNAAMVTIINAMTVRTEIPDANPIMADLLVSGGMRGMLNTIWLVIVAMLFGGAMEATGFLNRISLALMQFAKSTFSLIASTSATCLFVNVSASDQYLSIIVPGKIYKDLYREKGLAPENLSRTLEDTGTVTSVLIPWNTCGAYQSGILGVATWAYFPFAIFNWISPLMTLFFAALNIRIKKLVEK